MFPRGFAFQDKNQHEQVYPYIQQKSDQNAQNKYQGYKFAGLAFFKHGIKPHNPH